MPTKTSTSRIHSVQHYTTTFANGLPPSSGETPTSVLTSRSFSGDVVPGWRSKIRLKQNATSIANGFRHDTSGFPEGSGEFVHNDGTRYSTSGTLHRTPPRASQLSFSYGSVNTAARLKFINKYREARTRFQSGVFLGELRETLQMIKRPASAFRSGLDYYYGNVKERLRRKSNRKNIQDTVAGTYLEHAYGWNPLCRDIDEGMKALAALPLSNYEEIRGFAMEQLPTDLAQRDDQLISSVWVKTNFQISGSVSARYIGVVGAKRAPPTAWEKWGFTPSEILPTIWELIPYSFLVDYFTNIGDVISAASFGNVELSWGCQTLRGERAVYSGGSTVYSRSASVKGSGSGGSYSDRFTSFSRTHVSNLEAGVSDFRFELPGFGSKKWLNIGALAAMRR